MISKKIVSIVGGKIKIQVNAPNPNYDFEFDRLDRMGCYSIDNICKTLDEKGIPPEITSTKTILMKDISFKKLFYILDGMITYDLVHLLSQITYNDTIKTIIRNIILSRNLKIDVKQHTK